MEGRFGQELSSVRLHTDGSAAASARALDAEAYTVGEGIVFSRYAPQTKAGTSLLAHELAHVIQQRGNGPAAGGAIARDAPDSAAERAAREVARGGDPSGLRPLTGGPVVQRQAAPGHGAQPGGPADPDPAGGGVGFVLPLFLTGQQAPEKVDTPVTVEVPGPWLTDPGKRRARDVELLTFQTAPRHVADFLYFVVPVGSVFPSLQAALASHVKPPAPPTRPGATTRAASPAPLPLLSMVTGPQATAAPAPAEAPPATTAGSTPAAAAPPAATHLPEIQGPPSIAVGSTVYTPDGKAHVVLGATPSTITTEVFTKYAVGAGSTGLLETGGNFIVVDAGVFGLVDHGVREATLAALEARIGKGGVINQVLITHAHADHMDLLPELARRFRIKAIRINALQADRKDFRDLLDEVRKAHRDRVNSEANRVRAELEAQRPAWERADRGDPLTRPERWATHRDGVVRQTLDAIPDIALELLVPGVRGKLAISSLPIEPPILAPAPAAGTQELAPGVRAPAVTDPEFADELTERAGKGPEKGTLDKFSSSWLIDVRGYTRFLVLPDVRGEDLRNLLEGFRDATAELGLKSRFQVWDVGHHMQIGWSLGGTKPAGLTTSVRATQLGHITRFLHEFRAGTASTPGTDVVVVSAYQGFKGQKASYVDPANVWLLRSLGFEVYLATSGHDVLVLHVLTSQGTPVTGVIGQAAGGPRPPKELVRTAEAALAELRDRARIQRDRLQQLKDSPDAAAREAAQAELDRITRTTADIDRLRLEYKDAVIHDMSRSTRAGTPAGPSGGPAPAPQEPAAAQALEQRLTAEGLYRPVAPTGPARFSEAAVAIVRPSALDPNAPADSPAGRALELTRARERIRQLEGRPAGTVDPVQARAELLAELHRYRVALEAQVRTPANVGVSRQVLDDELRTVRKRITDLTPGPEVRSLNQRVPGMAAMAETKVVSAERLRPAGEAAAPPAPTLGQRTGAAIEAVTTRGFGALMVYQSFHAETDVLVRASQGRASAAEALATTAHSALGVSVGYRMLRGAQVSPGVFVVISLLEVAEAATRDYASADQRRTEIAYAALRGGVNLGLMYVGGVLMAAIPPPLGVLAGLGVMMLGDTILEALGAHDWIEQLMSFQPRQVTKAEQRMRDLLKEYEVIVGAIELAERPDPSLRKVGSPDPATTRMAALAVANAHRVRAYPLERRLLDTFTEAYARAQGAYAGLAELDALRKRFYELLQRAHANDEELAPVRQARAELLDIYRERSGVVDWQAIEAWRPMMTDKGKYLLEREEPVAIREQARATFEKIERDLSLAAATPESVESMEQWDDIDSKLTAINGRLVQSYFARDDDAIPYDDYIEMLDEAQKMISNARYRVQPPSGAYRTAGILPPTAPGYRTYMNLLEERERRFWWTQHRLAEMVAGRTPRPGPEAFEFGHSWEELEHDPGAAGARDARLSLRVAEAAMRTFGARLTEMPRPPKELVDAMFTNSADIGSRYSAYLDKHDDYKRALTILEFQQSLLVGLIDHARQVVDPAGTVTVIGPTDSPEKERLKSLMVSLTVKQNMRYHELGLIYPSEVPALLGEVKAAELEQFRMALGVPADVEPLTAMEQRAAREGLIRLLAPRLGSTADRLARIPELRRAGPDGKITGIYRLLDPVPEFHLTGGPQDTPATRSRNALVGDLGEGRTEIVAYGRYGKGYPTRRVIPINAAAIDALGGTDEQVVRTERLARITMAELKP
jgi:hypothetical protein